MNSTDKSTIEDYHYEKIRETFRMFALQKGLPMNEWVEGVRVMPEGSPIPGTWKNSYTPYLIWAMTLFTNQVTRKIVLKMASQMGKTEFLNNCIGYTISQAPRPMLFFFPTDKMGERYAKLRLKPAFHSMSDIPRLLRGGGQTNKSFGEMVVKLFEGGFLIISGANSPSNFASFPVSVAFLDELDRYPKDVKGEGSPVGLVEKRFSNFINSKLILSSTPTSENDSQIQEEFESTNKHRYYVPCPKCSKPIRLLPERLVLEGGIVYCECTQCNFLIPETEKFEMVNKGEWLSDTPSKGIEEVGLEISTLYSLFGAYNSSWAKLYEEFEAAKKNENNKKEFWNTRLALPYGYSFQEMLPAKEMYSSRQLRKKYKFCLTTAAVDVQNDRLEMEVQDWGKRFERRPVKNFVFRGYTRNDRVWLKLLNHLKENPHNIDSIGIDCGYNADYVFSFIKHCRVERRKGNKLPEVLALKGVPMGNILVSPSRSSLRAHKGEPFYNVDVNAMKEIIYKSILDSYNYRARITKERPPSFYCHWYTTRKDYYSQICSEKAYLKNIRGLSKVVYEKIEGVERNEILDLWVYNLAVAVKILGTDFDSAHASTVWKLLEERKATQRSTRGSTENANTIGFGQSSDGDS